MASQVEICNLALSHIGIGKEIANLTTENSEEASAFRRFYTPTLEAILRDYNWPFAKRFQSLALVEEDPTEEWAFSYRYPTDALMVRRILSGIRNDTNDSRIRYVIAQDSQGRLIYTDQENAEIEYTVRITDTSYFPPDFVMAFSERLGAYVAPRLTKGDPFKVGERAFKLYQFEINTTRANSMNEQQEEIYPTGEFVRARE